MDFEVLDNVMCDSLAPGDIVQEEGEFHQIEKLWEDDGTTVTYDTYNLSTGDEDSICLDPFMFINIYRSY